MKNHQEIERLIDKSFEALEEVSPVAPNPFLYTRLRARMEETEVPAWSIKLSLVSFSILLILNIGFVWSNRQTNQNSNERNGIDAFVEEYHLSNSQNL